MARTKGLDENASTTVAPDFGDNALRCLLVHESEHVASNAPHLDLLGTFGDAIAAVMPVDVLERLVP
jgi:hypothetical protein